MDQAGCAEKGRYNRDSDDSREAGRLYSANCTPELAIAFFFVVVGQKGVVWTKSIHKDPLVPLAYSHALPGANERRRLYFCVCE